MTDSLTLSLGERSYPIHFGADFNGMVTASEWSPAKRRGGDVVLVDENVARAQTALMTETFGSGSRMVLPSGEKTKSLEFLGRVLDFLAEHRVERSGLLWVVGGGVTGDLGGFAAASYLRGVNFVQVPTTLLAMVDSSVGGKTGINLAAGKNLAGAFHHPKAVFICPRFLTTLPAREFAAGMAEVIKYGLLGDPALFGQLEQAPLTAGSAGLLAVIRRCCEIKARIVEADERETAADGGRALLNLGHTFGHAIEQATGFADYLHGEAVAVGLAAAARLSQKFGLLPAADVVRVEAVVAAHGLPVRLRQALTVAALVAAMKHDKKARSGRLRFVVLGRLGEAATREDVGLPVVEAVWRELGAV